MIEIEIENARTVAQWIIEKRGVALWKSCNLSNPDDMRITPATLPDHPQMLQVGAQIPQHQLSWEFPVIHEITTDPNQIQVYTTKEVRRFKIATRISSNGLTEKLTDASSKKLKKALDKYPGCMYGFGCKEAVIVVKDKVITLKEWMDNEDKKSPPVSC